MVQDPGEKPRQETQHGGHWGQEILGPPGCQGRGKDVPRRRGWGLGQPGQLEVMALTSKAQDLSFPICKTEGRASRCGG